MVSRLKIGFIVEQYPPTSGGVATSAQRIAQELTKLGCSIRVFSLDSKVKSSDFPEHEEHDNGVRILRFGPFHLQQNAVDDSIGESEKSKMRRRVFNQVVSKLKDESVDIIFSFYLINSGYIGLLVARELSVPFVAGVRGNDIGKNIFHIYKFAVTQWIINGANKVICVNEHLQNRLLLAFPDAKQKSLVIPNGVRMQSGMRNKNESKSKLNEITGWNNNDLILGFTGVLREKKGIHSLLKALDLCTESNVRLLVVGPEIGLEERLTCGNMWDKLKANNLIFTTGNIPRSDINSWLSGCDAIVMPSLDDGMANGLLEGMAIGLCPIVSEIFRDVVKDGINGLTVPCDNVEYLAKTIIKLNSDRKLTQVLGARAQESIIKDHTPEKEALRYIEIFNQIILPQKQYMIKEA